MKVTNTNITDKELAEVLSQAGMDEKQIKAFLSGCCDKGCCAEKVRFGKCNTYCLSRQTVFQYTL